MITATEKIKKLKINILVGKRMNSWDNASIERYIKLSLLVSLIFMLRFYLYVFVSRSQKMVGGDGGSAFLDVPFGFLGFYATMLLSV